MKNRSIALFIFYTLFASQCMFANGLVKEFSPFCKIKVSGDVDLKYVQDIKFSVEVKGDLEAQKAVKTSLENNTLTIERDETSYFNKGRKITVILRSPVIYELVISNDADFSTAQLHVDAPFTLNADNDCDIEIGFLAVTGKTTINLSKESDCKIKKMEVSNFDLNCNAKSDFEANTLNGDNVVINASGASEVELKGGKIDNLTINASRDSEVKVKKIKYNSIQTNTL